MSLASDDVQQYLADLDLECARDAAVVSSSGYNSFDGAVPPAIPPAAKAHQNSAPDRDTLPASGFDGDQVSATVPSAIATVAPCADQVALESNHPPQRPATSSTPPPQHDSASPVLNVISTSQFQGGNVVVASQVESLSPQMSASRVMGSKMSAGQDTEKAAAGVMEELRLKRQQEDSLAKRVRFQSHIKVMLIQTPGCSFNC